MRSTAPLRLLALAAVAGLARGSPASCALHSPLEGGGRQLLQVSDGQVLLSATWQPGLPGLDGCRLTVEAQAVAAFLQRCEQQKQQPESTKTTTDAFPSLEAAKAACLSFQPDGGLAFASRRRAKRGFTYPGTLWCGAGDMAESYDQLGEHEETDRCCREHDHCQHVIYPFTYNYGYRNFRLHTISHCDCDNRLRDCLRTVNDTISRVVGQAFFNVIQAPCFELTYKEHCAEPYFYLWCKNYSTIAVAVVQDSARYDYGGKVIEGPATPQPPGQSSSTSAPFSSRPQPMTTSAALTRPPGQATLEVIPTPGLLPTPGRLPKKYRKGQKGTKKKGRKGKGLKKKQKLDPKGDTFLYPVGEEATTLPKQLAPKELAKIDFQPLARVPQLGEDNPFNAILNDEPAGGSLQAEEDALLDPQKTGAGLSTFSPLSAPLKKRKREKRGRKRARQQLKQRWSLPAESS